MADWIKLLIFSSVAVIFLFIISKLMGKKQIAQLEFIDYVMGISIGSIAAEMATDVGDTPFYYYLIGMTIFFLFDLLVSYLGRKGPAMKHFFKGRPLMIIYKGEINFKNLKKSRLDINDVIEMCREKGYFDMSQIEYAIFENSGKLSILTKNDYKPIVEEDIGLALPKVKLPIYLIVDGRISFSSLDEIKKDKEWLYKKAKLNDKTIKNVLLATFIPDDNEIICQVKDKNKRVKIKKPTKKKEKSD